MRSLSNAGPQDGGQSLKVKPPEPAKHLPSQTASKERGLGISAFLSQERPQTSLLLPLSLFPHL
jgi:hypothetical protein